jgi:hypothetical protein
MSVTDVDAPAGTSVIEGYLRRTCVSRWRTRSVRSVRSMRSVRQVRAWKAPPSRRATRRRAR